MSTLTELMKDETTALLDLYELDFRHLNLVPEVEVQIRVDVGASFGSLLNVEVDSVANPLKVLNFDSISYVGKLFDPDSSNPSVTTPPDQRVSVTTSAGGTIEQLYSDTVRYTPPAGFTGVDVITVVSNGGALLYFHAGMNELSQEVIWQGNRYYALPIESEGFDRSGTGQLPRPILRIANALSVISQFLETFDNLLGAKVTRKRTYARYLDGVNFEGGNPLEDATAELPNDVYRIDRKTSENDIVVEFELATAWDIEGIQLPRRTVIKNLCSWRYKSSECGYNPDDTNKYWDEFNKPTTASKDVCSKQLTGCALRFEGLQEGLPYGGFPGAGIQR